MNLEEKIKQLRGKLEKAAETAGLLHPQTQLAHKNKLESFDYIVAELQKKIEALELEVAEIEHRYRELHQDTQKLVYLCEIHGLNPNMIFVYDQEFLSYVARNREKDQHKATSRGYTKLDALFLLFKTGQILERKISQA